MGEVFRHSKCESISPDPWYVPSDRLLVELDWSLRVRTGQHGFVVGQVLSSTFPSEAQLDLGNETVKREIVVHSLKSIALNR